MNGKLVERLDGIPPNLAHSMSDVKSFSSVISKKPKLSIKNGPLPKNILFTNAFKGKSHLTQMICVQPKRYIILGPTVSVLLKMDEAKAASSRVSEYV